MALHNDFGKKGEVLAAAWLTQQGYEILDRNWRQGRYEVDIIARLDGITHFIEVKSAQTNGSQTIPEYGYPEERVDNRKIRNLMKGAAAWLYRFPGSKRVQYDVLSVMVSGDGSSDGDAEYFMIGDVYLH